MYLTASKAKIYLNILITKVNNEDQPYRMYNSAHKNKHAICVIVIFWGSINNSFTAMTEAGVCSFDSRILSNGLLFSNPLN